MSWSKLGGWRELGVRGSELEARGVSWGLSKAPGKFEGPRYAQGARGQAGSKGSELAPQVYGSMHIRLLAYMAPCIYGSMCIQLHVYMAPCIYGSIHIWLHVYMAPCIYSSMHIRLHVYTAPCIYGYMCIQCCTYTVFTPLTPSSLPSLQLAPLTPACSQLTH